MKFYFPWVLLLGAVPSAMGQCSSLSATNLAFGNYSATALSSTATITVNCPSGYAYSLAINGGSSGNTASRQMVYQSASIGYNMYKDAAHTAVWGDSPGADTVSGVGTGANQTYTVYGYMAAQQNAIAGNYTDYPAAINLSNGQVAGFNATTTVTSACFFVVTSLPFGNYTGLSNVDGTFTVYVQCTSGSSYGIGISAGANSGGGFYNWRMHGPGASYLNYSIYRDAARTQLWGGSPGSDAPQGTGTGSPQMLTGYGRVPAHQFVTPGSYSDSVQMTIYF